MTTFTEPQKDQLRRFAMDETWQSSQAFRWATRFMSVRRVSEELGISKYRVRKQNQIRVCQSNTGCRNTVLVKTWDVVNVCSDCQALTP